jgi:hypothetical protein
VSPVPRRKPRGLRFCEDCGSRLTLTCGQCGGELAPGKRFCGSCGAPAAGESASRTPSPESYTPKHLVERILTSKAALEGEGKQVTVLFADLKGSMLFALLALALLAAPLAAETFSGSCQAISF